MICGVLLGVALLLGIEDVSALPQAHAPQARVNSGAEVRERKANDNAGALGSQNEAPAHEVFASATAAGAANVQDAQVSARREPAAPGLSEQAENSKTAEDKKSDDKESDDKKEEDEEKDEKEEDKKGDDDKGEGDKEEGDKEDGDKEDGDKEDEDGDKKEDDKKDEDDDDKEGKNDDENGDDKDDEEADDEEADDKDDDSKDEDSDAKKSSQKRGSRKDKSASQNDEKSNGKDASSSKGASAKASAKEGADKDADKDAEKNADDQGKSDSSAETKENEPAKKGEPEASKDASLHVVETKNLKIEETLEGVFAAAETETVELRPEAWSTFEVSEAVAHGTPVRKGDVLVKFDDEKFNQTLEEKSLEQRLGEVALMHAQEEFPRMEKSVDIELEEAQRSYDAVTDEFDRFVKTMRPLSIKMADYNLKAFQQDLDNAREELTQLEKMYKADEITEETEEIVLKRQRFQVEMYEFYMEYSRIQHDYTIDVAIPRREETLTTAVELSRIALDRAKAGKSLGLSKERYQLEQLKEARERSVEQHAKLTADRALMTLRAPSDGIAYYGRCVNGKWIDVPTLESKLVKHGAIPPDTVVMTIVQPRPVYVESSCDEKQIIALKQGMKADVAPTSDEDLTLEGKIRSASAVPGAGNRFPIQLDIDAQKAPEWLNPGMTCKAKIVTYEAKDAVVIPEALLQTDEENAKLRYVMVQEEGAEKPVRRDLKLGKKQGKEVEVLSGLKAGDKIAKDKKAE